MCMIYGAEETPEFFVKQTPTARKAHRCGECGRTIRPGEIYERVRGKWNGDVGTEKTCAHCVAARAWLEKHCVGYLFQGVQEDLWEHWRSEYRQDRLGRLVVGMRRKWERFGGGLMAVPAGVPATTGGENG